MLTSVAGETLPDHRRPRVLGVVQVWSADDLPGALFQALAHAADGADGLDVVVGGAASPAERLHVADQLRESSGLAVAVRTDTPMSSGEHSLILSGRAGRLRAGAKVFYDLELDRMGAEPDDPSVKAEWLRVDDRRSWLVSTSGFASASPAQLMGLAASAFHVGAAAVSTDGVRTVRRVLDTLAPLSTPSGSASSCP